LHWDTLAGWSGLTIVRHSSLIGKETLKVPVSEHICFVLNDDLPNTRLAVTMAGYKTPQLRVDDDGYRHG